MKLLIDFFPIILFFVAFKIWGIYVATGVAIAATVAQIAYLRLRQGKIEPMQWLSLGVIVVFGGATLLAQNETFIKWKPTVLYIAMALTLAVALWGMKKNLLHILLGGQLKLPDFVWNKLTIAWVGYCLFMAGINAVMVVFFSTEQWISFKLWGYVFPLAFLVGQGIYIARHLKEGLPGRH